MKEPKYKLGTMAKIEGNLFTNTIAGAIVGIKISEEKDAKTQEYKTTYVYNLSGNASWYYEHAVVPLTNLDESKGL